MAALAECLCGALGHHQHPPQGLDHLFQLLDPQPVVEGHEGSARPGGTEERAIGWHGTRHHGLGPALIPHRQIESRDPIEDPDTLWVHELIGADVIDVDGEPLGTVESVLENPASDILVLEDERLIPLTFFVERRDDGTIVVDPPDGLFDPIDADKP